MDLQNLNLGPFLLHVADCVRCREFSMQLGLAAISGSLPPVDDRSAGLILESLCPDGRSVALQCVSPGAAVALPRPVLQTVQLTEDEAAARRAETLAMLAELEEGESNG